MVFLVGPRQVGKTTTSLEVSHERAKHYYLTWDIQKDQKLIRKGADDVAAAIGLDTYTSNRAYHCFSKNFSFTACVTLMELGMQEA